MSEIEFILRVACALICGAAIGIERQWRQRTAGLRTYTLVSVGAALFVAFSQLLSHDASPSRIAAQVVSGVGFLGAGVIMRSGLNVRGLNTAATIWCSSAVGTLAGAGQPLFAAIGALAVLSINLLLRPLVAAINRQPGAHGEDGVRYALTLSCRGRQETPLRALLVQLVTTSPVVLNELVSLRGESGTSVMLKAVLSLAERDDAQMEQLAGRLGMEPGVQSLVWKRLAGDVD